MTSAGEYFLLVFRFIVSVGAFSVGFADLWRRGSFVRFLGLLFFLGQSVLFLKYCFIII